MEKSDQIIVRKLSYEQLEQRFSKIGRDFKEYKKEWVFNVVRNKNIFTISAYSTKKFVYIDYRCNVQSAKNMVISVEEKEAYLLLSKSFKFRSLDFFWVKIIPNLTYIMLIVNTTYIVISFLQQGRINELFGKIELVIIVFSLGWYYKLHGSKRLEIERNQIIEEILQRLIYD